MTDDFFTQSDKVTQEARNTPQAHNTQKKQKAQKVRYNLMLDEDINEFLRYISWSERKSMTKYLNDLLREEKKKYEDQCRKKGIEPFGKDLL